MAKTLFITGTDTGVGKTVITGLVGRFFLEKGKTVITQKWVETGSSFAEDINTHLRLMAGNKKEIKEYLKMRAPYVFKFPASPHLAASLENRRISAEKIKHSFYKLVRKRDFLIVEGTGGFLVPINKNKLMAEIVKELNLPVLVVAANRLGAINHTLLTLEALKKRKLKVIGVIFNRLSKKGNEIVFKDNMEIVGRISKVKIFGELIFDRNIEKLYKSFKPIAEGLYDKF